MLKGLSTCIFFSRQRALLSRLIRWITRSKVSHTGVVYYDETLGHPMVMHAIASGFQVSPLVHFRRDSEIVATYEAKDQPALLKAIQGISLELGDGYDYRGVAGFLWVIMLKRWLHVKRNNPVRDSNRMFCSEAVACILQKMQDSGWQGDPETTSPEDLLEWVGRSPAFTLVKL